MFHSLQIQLLLNTLHIFKFLKIQGHCLGEFISCILKECRILSHLTTSEIISTYKCYHCGRESNNAESQERFENIRHFDINGPSVAEIIHQSSTSLQPGYLKRCNWCDVLDNHQTEKTWLIKPSSLVIRLERSEATKHLEVEPSAELNIEGINYVLRGVIGERYL